MPPRRRYQPVKKRKDAEAKPVARQGVREKSREALFADASPVADMGG